MASRSGAPSRSNSVLLLQWIPADPECQGARPRPGEWPLTERERLAAENLESLDEIEQIYRSAPVGLCLVDTDLRIRRINERQAAITGLPVQEHLGRHVEEVVAPEIAEQILPSLRKVLAIGEPIENLELRRNPPSRPDHPRTWLMSCHPVKAHDGKVSGIITVVQEITDLKRREEEIRAARARLAMAEREARLGCYEWNLLTGEVWWSEGLYRITGRDPHTVEPSFEEFVEQIVEADRGRVRAQLDQVFAGEGSAEVEYRIHLPDGSERVIRSRAHLRRNAEGEPHILFGTGQDITEDRRTVAAFDHERAALEARNAELERLLQERTAELDRALDRLRRRR